MKRAEINNIVEKLWGLKRKGIEEKANGKKLNINDFYDALQNVETSDLSYFIKRLNRDADDVRIEIAERQHSRYINSQGRSEQSRRKADIIRIIYLLGGVFTDDFK